MENDTSGFYKYYETELLFGPNFVSGQGFELARQVKDSYVYPIDGWWWFDSRTEAQSFFNISPDTPL